MKRSVSIEDLFGSDSDVDLNDSNRTVDLAPVGTPSKETNGRDTLVSTNVINLDSSGSSSSPKSNSQRLGSVKTRSSQEIGCRGRSDSDSSVSEKSEKIRRLQRDLCANSATSSSSSTSASRSAMAKPVCQYGKQCYRKNPKHFQEFDHPEGCVFQDEVSSSKRQRLDDEKGGLAGPSRTSNSQRCVSSLIEQSRPFSFFLTKVHGIESKFNSASAIGIKELLSPSLGELQKSVQFNYCIDISWLVSQYPPQFRDKPLLVVHGFKGEEKTSLQEQAAQYENVRLCQAPLEMAFGTHHTKMMILLYDSGLRVIIHTANLIDRDWYQKTQGVWVSPVFPKLKAGNTGDGDSSTKFKRDLIEYLSAYRQRSLDEWITAIRQSDMSSANVVLVGSVPGRHCGEKKTSFGHLKLRKVLQEFGPDNKSVSSWPVIGQFSSVGSLGQSSDTWLTSEWVASMSMVKGSALNKANLQLVFPSKENVRRSLEGYPAGAAIPYSIHTARKQPYFNTYLHQWKSERQGRTRASPHIKTYTRASADGTQLAWFLVTSANMSKAAWGSLEKNGSQLFIRSYELGVLFLPHYFEQVTFKIPNSNPAESRRLTSSASSFPFPFDLPPTPYGKDDRPWIWDIPYTDKPDSNGNIWSPS